MSKKTHNDISIKAINYTALAEDSMGALELLYPGADGYRGVFETYHPEIADDLVARREVRFLVETRYNARLCGRLLLGCGDVSDELALGILEAGDELEALLWDLCDTYALAYASENNWSEEVDVERGE